MEEGSRPMDEGTLTKLLEGLLWLHHRLIMLSCYLACWEFSQRKSSNGFWFKTSACFDQILAVEIAIRCLFGLITVWFLLCGLIFQLDLLWVLSFWWKRLFDVASTRVKRCHLMLKFILNVIQNILVYYLFLPSTILSICFSCSWTYSNSISNIFNLANNFNIQTF